MGVNRGLWRWFANLWGQGRVERELDEEIRFHIERQTEKNVRAGMSPEAARRDALLRFGGVEATKEAARGQLRPVVVEELARDARQGARALARSPGFAAAAVLTLGLGVGAATSVYTVVDGVLLDPLPYPGSERIVRLHQLDGEGRLMSSVSHANYEDWRSRTRSFAAMAAYTGPRAVSVSGTGDPHRAEVAAVSRGFPAVMEMGPESGRGFLEEEQAQGARPVALVSRAYARSWLEGDGPGAILSFGGSTYEVVGVMPPEFDFPAGTDIWIPLERDPPFGTRTAHNYRAVGRVAAGVSLEQAASDLSAVSRAIKAQYGDESYMADATIVPLRESVTGPVAGTLWLLFGASGFLLLVAVSNLSNLLLARAETRRREVAVRRALGAGRLRLLRQFTTEAVVLGLAGGLLGLLVALWGVRALLALEPGGLPRIDNIGVSWAALGFALAVATLAAVLLGVLTSLRSGGEGPRNDLLGGGRGASAERSRQRLRDALVVAQVALTVVLLAGAGLLARSFVNLVRIDPGFRTADALLLDFALPPAAGPEALDRRRAFQEELLERLGRLPGVTAVGLATGFPLGGADYADGTFLEMTRPDEIRSFEDLAGMDPAEFRSRAGDAGLRIVSPGYFTAMGIPVLSGRALGPADGRGSPHAAVISRSLAERRWPERDPIGRFIQFGNMDGDPTALVVVGVVGDVREGSPAADPGPLLYADFRQRPVRVSSFTIVVRGPRPEAISTAAQRVVRELDPQLPVTVRTLSGALDASLAGRRFSLVLIGAFGAAALLLAALGIYGVVAYLVSRRTREIGIRLALGADPARLVRLVLRKGVTLALLGLAVGMVAALALTRLLESRLFGVSPADPLALTGVAIAIGAIAVAASYVPTRRALAIQPATTLREE